MIDGDLCELYNSMDASKRRSIADELDRTPSEVGITTIVLVRWAWWHCGLVRCGVIGGLVLGMVGSPSEVGVVV